MSVVSEIEKSFKKPHVVDVRSGDTVRVYQKIREGGKERVQYFEGLVIRTDRKNSHTASITVRRIASGIGVEKTYLLHSPLVTKIEVKKRSKVRRKYLSYMRERTGKSARLSSREFDREAVNAQPQPTEPTAKPQEVKTEIDKVQEADKPAEVEKPAVKTDESKQQDRDANKAEKADKKAEASEKAKAEK